MSEIKQINTGVAEVLAVKVPEGAIRFAIEQDALFCHIKAGVYKLVKLPPGKWTPLGIDTELTEEDFDPLVDHAMGTYLNYLTDKYELDTSKEAFESLMQANSLYSVNPYEQPTFEYDFGDEGPTDYLLESANNDFDLRMNQWQQAEANTGTWLILKRLS